MKCNLYKIYNCNKFVFSSSKVYNQKATAVELAEIVENITETTNNRNKFKWKKYILIWLLGWLVFLYSTKHIISNW